MPHIEKTKGSLLDPLLTVEEACAVFSVHRNTLRRWELRGWLRATRLGVRAKRYKRSEVESLINRKTRASR